MQNLPGAGAHASVAGMAIRAAALICAFVALLACQRSPGPPDANYEQASHMYQLLYAQKLDDAYGDPQMDEVVSLLHRVDSRSIDATAAQALLAAIEDGRKRFQAARAEREKAQNAPVEPVAMPNIDPSAVAGSAREPAPPPDPFTPGASVADLNAASGGCLVAAEPFHENGTNVNGTIYRMSPSPACSDRLAGFVGQAALVVDGKLYRRVAESELRSPAAAPPRPQPGGAQASAATKR
jgi:hypothetical protein